MSTVKISELPVITQINANTANTLFVGLDLPTNVTGRMTLTTLAQGLYSNNDLLVGNTNVLLPNAVAQFTGTSELYIQTSLQNLDSNGSGDLVVTADNGTDTTNYIDMGMAGSTYVFEGDSLNKPNDGYLIVVGEGAGIAGGNLAIGTLTEGKDINFFQGGLSEANVALKISSANGVALMQKPLTFADGTTQNTAVDFANVNSRITSNTNTINGSIAANVSLINGYISTNVAILRGEVSGNVTTLTGQIATNAASANSVINSRISSNIATANAFTQASFDKANNALANSSGTFAGDLNITGNTQVASINTANLSVVGTANVSGTLNVVGAVSMNATLVMSNVNFNATESALTISASQSIATPANDGYMIHVSGKNGVASRIVTDSYGTGAYALYAGRAARGTVESPTALQAGDVISRYSSSGYGTTKYHPFGSGRIDFVATENYTDANTGSQIQFWNCPNGSNTLTNIATFNGDSVTFTGQLNPAKGVVYTPRLPAGDQTAITINYVTDSVIKANCAAGLAFTHTNFVSGKIVEVWITNTAGIGHTVTHGCSALNSTTNSTTINIPSTSSMHLKFFSIGGDIANTFVAVTPSA